MSNMAKGKDGKNHFADDFSDPYAGEYYCPDSNCNAKLILKNLGSDLKERRSIRPYFSALPSQPHAEGCEYSKACLSYSDLKSSGFNAEDFWSNLLSPGNQRRLTPAKGGKSDGKLPQNPPESLKISTLNQLYKYCLQHDDRHVLPDGTRVYEIYQEKRNEMMSGRSKTRIVKLNFKNCNFQNCTENELKVWCYYPHTENSKPPAFYYTLGFDTSNKALMNYFCEILNAIKSRHGYAHLIVCGEWNSNHCKIRSKRQIFILKPK